MLHICYRFATLYFSCTARMEQDERDIKRLENLLKPQTGEKEFTINTLSVQMMCKSGTKELWWNQERSLYLMWWSKTTVFKEVVIPSFQFTSQDIYRDKNIGINGIAMLLFVYIFDSRCYLQYNKYNFLY